MKEDVIVDIEPKEEIKTDPLYGMLKSLQSMNLAPLEKHVIRNMIFQGWNLALVHAMELLSDNRVIHHETMRKLKDSMKDRGL